MAPSKVSTEPMKRAVNHLAKTIEKFALENTTAARGFRFLVGNKPVGVIRPAEWEILQKYGGAYFEQKQKDVHFKECSTEAEASKAMATLLADLREKDVFPCLRGWRNELYSVRFGYDETPIVKIERAGTFIFGTIRSGVDINGCVEDDTGKLKAIWLQRRSKTKELFPGLLDLFVSGGLGSSETPTECMKKECLEEASLPIELCEKYVRPSSCVIYMYENDLGFDPSLSFVFDARFPDDYEPKPSDGEVEEFTRFPLATADDVTKLIELICDPASFKPTSVPVVADLLIRRGLIDSTFGADFLRIIETIHQPLHKTYPPKPADK